MRVGTFVLAAQFPGQGRGEALHRAVRTAEVAEESGLDGVWLAEHHFVPYGVCPSAVTLAAVLLGRTRRIRVGTAVSVLPNVHPVALGEQAALLHITSGGRFSLGVGRGGPWIDLEVFGAGIGAYESGFPESLDLLLRWLREPSVGASGERYRFREVSVVPRPADLLDSALRSGAVGTAGAHGGANGGTAGGTGGGGATTAGSGTSAGAPDAHPEVVVACTSPGGVRVAGERGLPMLLGMHCGDEEKAEMIALWRRHALAAGHCPDAVAAAGHVSAGVVQLADEAGDARESLLKAMPGWLRTGLAAHRTVDDRARTMRDPVAYTELLCSLHPVGPPRLAADRLAATAERTGITRFALLAEGSGDLASTETTVRRLGEEVLPLLV
ncbi:LLM class flavin-dependent oxidoreductase [Streptomyces qinzhouensis]|uniref:LLM class flavin-dependent oxidoreductase n=1 Tax=Streptomyces qinzhouensis TaxID=2599401 RepID=A0A5B8INE3_9ACTN|nr:LLM class flavin-dependent oxidoreductase [Streptomyces qinzhouensis]QDY79059.1 LLM class flavin-dependent oxidoreductase [Streptomyces qinzhouensis]